jgi:predicted ATPase
LASLAAVIGRSFTFAVLTQASDLAEDALVRGLDELWQRRIAREQGVAAYDFSHDRIRDVAYAAVSPARRRWLHRRVAQALEMIQAGDLDPVSGQIAVHYEQANLIERAIPYCQQAAEVAQRTYAHADAVNYLSKGLALLARLPVTAEHMRRELSLQLALGLSLSLVKGGAAQEVRMAYERAEALSVQVGDNYAHLVALCGQFVSIITAGQLQKARELAGQAFALAEQLENPRWLAETRGMLGVVLEHMGEWATSRAYLEQALARYNFQADDSLTLFHDLPIQLTQRRNLAMVLWHLGYPDQALERMNETVALSQAIDHPNGLAHTLNYSARLHQHRREAALTQTQAETAVALCKQYGLFASLADSMSLAGWALVQQGQGAEGIARIHAGLVVRQTRGIQLHLPVFLALLAEIYGQVGQPEQGLRVVDEALAMVEATEEHFAEVDLYRLKGELLHIQGVAGDEIESCLQQAVAIARHQNAKSLELRAALSLARLWQQQSKRIQAHDLLAEIYGWFTEGFDTLDLQEAKALLDELA